jgi:hypothetical protein
MAMAFRPFASSASMNSRNGSHALGDGAEAGVEQSSRLTDYKPFMVRWLRQVQARD